MAAPQSSTTPSLGAPSEPSSLPSQVPNRSIFHVLGRRHLDDFREDSKKKILDELAPSFPGLQTVLQDREEGSSEPAYRRILFQLLEAAKKAQADQRPTILFAADLVASHVRCDADDTREEAKAYRARLQSDLARYDLTLKEDTSGICKKGEDQTREVIRQGESFLKERPGSPHRGVVTLLVAEAYA